MKGSTCRDLLFDFLENGKRLENHVIDLKQSSTEDFCQVLCYMNNKCVSINFRQTPDSSGVHLCELNDSDKQQHPDDLKDEKEFSYRETMHVSLYKSQTLYIPAPTTACKLTLSAPFSPNE